MASCSILLPAYNGEKYLKRALDSIVNQTYKDFEVILIDDGSTDSTPQICDEYAKKYSFIHTFHQKNVGPFKIREKLLEKAKGKYIFFLDQDDYYDLTLLEKTMRAFEQTHADVVGWGKTRLTMAGDRIENPIEEWGAVQWQKRTAWGVHPETIYYSAPKSLWNQVERTPDPDGGDLVDDVWFTSQLVPKAKKVVSLGEALYFYDNTNLNSVTHNISAKALYRAAKTFYEIIKRNQKTYPEDVPPNLEYVRKYMVNSYCVAQIDNSLSSDQKELLREALKYLFERFPQKKTKKFYFIQLCVIYGIDFYCRIYGKGRLKRFKQSTTSKNKEKSNK